MVRDTGAVSKSKFSQLRSFSDQGGNGLILEIPAILKVDFENVTAICCEGDNSLVGQLSTPIQFQLYEVSISPMVVNTS